MRLQRLLALVATCMSLAPLAASAHTGADAGLHHGFAAGFLHPLLGADHLAAMVAVGLWSALVMRPRAQLLAAPAAFAAMLLVGAMAGLTGLSLPAVEPMIAASLLALGLLVAARRQLAAPLAAALVGAFAVFHGIAHGQELAGTDGRWGSLAGMLAATLLLHAAGIALGLALRGSTVIRSRIAAIAGAGVALFGAALLGGLA